MKVLIAGCRDQTVPIQRIQNIIEVLKLVPTEIVSGACRGIDLCGEEWARCNGIPIMRFAAHWNIHGKKAGPLRNALMANYCDEAIIFWDGKSKGTKSMIMQMRRVVKPYTVIPLDEL